MRLLDVGKIFNIREVLLDYRQHLASVNFTADAIERQEIKLCLMQEHTQRKGKPMPIMEKSLHENQP